MLFFISKTMEGQNTSVWIWMQYVLLTQEKMTT